MTQEYRDHDKLLQSRDLRSLELEDVACVAYNPITGISPEGIGYFIPRLVEFALKIEQISQNEREPYLWAFILQLIPDSGWHRFSLFEKKHINFVCRVLKAISVEYIEFIKQNCFEEEFIATLNAWCDKSCA